MKPVASGQRIRKIVTQFANQEARLAGNVFVAAPRKSFLRPEPLAVK
jgi:hypothetical protein